MFSPALHLNCWIWRLKRSGVEKVQGWIEKELLSEKGGRTLRWISVGLGEMNKTPLNSLTVRCCYFQQFPSRTDWEVKWQSWGVCSIFTTRTLLHVLKASCTVRIPHFTTGTNCSHTNLTFFLQISSLFSPKLLTLLSCTHTTCFFPHGWGHTRFPSRSRAPHHSPSPAGQVPVHESAPGTGPAPGSPPAISR